MRHTNNTAALFTQEHQETAQSLREQGYNTAAEINEQTAERLQKLEALRQELLGRRQAERSEDD